MGPHSVREYAASVRPHYRLASRQEKGRLLDEFCRVTERDRKVVIRLLRRRPKRARGRTGRPRTYDSTTLRAPLEQVWEASDYLCSKRLAPFLPELVEALERHDELRLSVEQRTALVQISPATIDRLLRSVRRLHQRHGVATTSPSIAAVRAQVPVRTFGEWDNVAPGNVQADLLAHCGTSTYGFFLTSLLAVDVATGWIELQAVWGKGQQRVGSAVHHIRQLLPMPLLSLHTDNGGEFLNHILIPWCRDEHITFTRGRPHRKNDQAYVEQKNWSVLRRVIGYDRYCTRAAFLALEAVHQLLRPYVNFFQPLRKLISKERHGARVLKRYDRAQTPYRRLLASGVLTPENRAALDDEYLRLNPLQLRTDLEARLDALWKLADR
ncbi:MAG TPA: transposase [bacterium]|nr:transposase [bacterium]